MPDSFDNGLAAQYQSLFDTCIINKADLGEVDEVISRIGANKSAYDGVSSSVNIPWYFIGIIHCMEGSLSFNKHLHNGDPLTARTVQVPKGRPTAGNPPFTWQSSAIDALTHEGFTTITDWSIPGMLHAFEKYNGMGYRSHGINSPYLWSYSNHYTSGKFTSDKSFDPHAVSKQMGAAVLLKRMNDRGIVSGGLADTLNKIKTLGETVMFDDVHEHDDAKQLQSLLQASGQTIIVDGIAGNNTSDAYHNLTGFYLHGDTRRQG